MEGGNGDQALNGQEERERESITHSVQVSYVHRHNLFAGFVGWEVGGRGLLV